MTRIICGALYLYHFAFGGLEKFNDSNFISLIHLRRDQSAIFWSVMAFAVFAVYLKLPVKIMLGHFMFLKLSKNPFPESVNISNPSRTYPNPFSPIAFKSTVVFSITAAHHCIVALTGKMNKAALLTRHSLVSQIAIGSIWALTLTACGTVDQPKTTSLASTNAQSPTGSKGDTGPAGPKGDSGPVGAQGPAGPKGDSGSVGATGSAGSVGTTGSKGDSGSIGATGSAGAQGRDGTAGTAGAPGVGSYWTNPDTGTVWAFVATHVQRSQASCPAGFVLPTSSQIPPIKFWDYFYELVAEMPTGAAFWTGTTSFAGTSIISVPADAAPANVSVESNNTAFHAYICVDGPA